MRQGRIVLKKCYGRECHIYWQGIKEEVLYDYLIKISQKLWKAERQISQKSAQSDSKISQSSFLLKLNLEKEKESRLWKTEGDIIHWKSERKCSVELREGSFKIIKSSVRDYKLCGA